jgi:hypothetical protein
MESLPAALVSFIELLRPLFRAEVFASFCYLMMGILIGEAKSGTVRASVFAGSDYWPQRLSDLFCRHKLSHQAFMAKLAEVALASLYPAGLPTRLFWIADSTYAEKPYAKRIASVGLFHRTKRVVGRAKHLQGHCYVFAAHLYTQAAAKLPKWASVLVGAVVYVKGRSIPALVGALAQQLRLPSVVRHVWLVDRGILSRPLLRALGRLGHCVLGRVRCNQVVYFAPPPEAAARLRTEMPDRSAAELLCRPPTGAENGPARSRARADRQSLGCPCLATGCVAWVCPPCARPHHLGTWTEAETVVFADHRSGP